MRETRFPITLFAHPSIKFIPLGLDLVQCSMAGSFLIGTEGERLFHLPLPDPLI